MICPECDGTIKIPDDSVEGEIVPSPDCGEGYQLKKDGSGFKFVKAEKMEEDWGE
jgi:alpha-aminoadipate carrier protein LysW